MYVIRTLNEAREIIEKWMMQYNDERPHDSPNGHTAWEYLAIHNKPEYSNLICN